MSSRQGTQRVGAAILIVGALYIWLVRRSAAPTVDAAPSTASNRHQVPMHARIDKDALRRALASAEAEEAAAAAEMERSGRR